MFFSRNMADSESECKRFDLEIKKSWVGYFLQILRAESCKEGCMVEAQDQVGEPQHKKFTFLQTISSCKGFSLDRVVATLGRFAEATANKDSLPALWAASRLGVWASFTLTEFLTQPEPNSTLGPVCS